MTGTSSGHQKYLQVAWASGSPTNSVLSVLLDQASEALLDPPVEMTYGGELLLVRHDDAAGDEGRYHLARELQLRRVVLHALGSLVEDEGTQGLLAEGHEASSNPGG